MLFFHSTSISYFLLSASVASAAFSFIGFSYSVYVSTLLLVSGLFFACNFKFSYIKLIFFIFFLIAIVLMPPRLLASPVLILLLTPWVYRFNSEGLFVSWPLVSVGFVYLMYFLYGDHAPVSHNYLSILVCWAIIIELLFKRKPSYLYIPFILISFLYFGNRSSIFLLAFFFSGAVLWTFVFVSLIFTFSVYVSGLLPEPLASYIFGEGGILWRSSMDPRVYYISEFLQNFSFLDPFDYLESVHIDSSGYNNFHNSFVSVVYMDFYFGVAKLLFFLASAFSMPFNYFFAIFMRGWFDTFLLGSLYTPLVFIYIFDLFKTRSHEKK